MDADDLEPRQGKPKPKDLSIMSIEALREYIAELEAEIARAGEMIEQKELACSGAESFFRS